MKTNLSSYKNSLSKDLPAGLVVFFVALPLCLGISLASGAPLIAGIVSGIVGGIVIASLSGSSLSVSGPAAGLTVIVLNGITTLDNNFQAFLVAVVLAGIIQVALGYFKAGIIGLFFPSSVIKGMLAAIGLILILKQIPHFIGADQDFFGEMEFFQSNNKNTFSSLFHSFRNIQPGALIIGFLSLFIILFWDSKFLKRFAFFRLVPSALMVVLASVALSAVFTNVFPALAISETHLVNLPRIGSTSDLMNELNFPDFNFLLDSRVYLIAFTIAIVASLETLLSIEAADKLDPHKRVSPKNRELKAQGVGNIVAGLLGGLPLTAVIVRSSANINAGAETRISAIFHGSLLLLSLLFLAPFLNQIPLSALAAVLLVVGFKLTKPALYFAQFKLGRQQFLPFIVTVLAILFSDLLIGICIGLAFGIYYILKANYKSPYFYKKESYSDKEIIHLKLSEHVSFLNKASIVLTLDRLPANSHVIIDGQYSEVIDYDVLEAIQDFRTKAAEKNIALELRQIPTVQLSAAH